MDTGPVITKSGMQLLSTSHEGNKTVRKYRDKNNCTIITTHPTDLTPEENARRMKEVEKAAIKLLRAGIRAGAIQ